MISPTRRRTVGEVRSPRLLFALIGASAIVFGAVLYLTRYRNFFYDEWAWVVSRRGWDFNVFILPHGNHWSTIPILLWKVLFVTLGIRSHVPYEAALLVVHVFAVVLLFLLVRRRSGDLPAFAAALTLLVLGSGADEIVWAFQVAWVGSVAFGLLAMLLLDGDPPFPRRVLPVSAALLGSLMSSSVGIAFMVAVGGELLFDAGRRRFLLALVPPGALFLPWFLAFDTGRVPGIMGISADLGAGPRGWDYLTGVTQFVLIGLRTTAAGVFGLEGLGSFILPILLLLIGWNIYRRRKIASWQVGLGIGLVFWFLLVGSGRFHVGLEQAAQSRYIYVGAVFLLPLVADLVRQLPWAGLWRPALTTIFALLIASNAAQLADAAVSLVPFMRYEDADLQTVETFRSAPDLVTYRYLDNGVLPQLFTRDYLAATKELGSPASASTVMGLQQMPSDSGSYVDRVMGNLFGDALTVQAIHPTLPVTLSCVTADSSAGTALDFQIPDDQLLMLESSKSGDAFLFLGFVNPASSEPVKSIKLQGSTPVFLHLPNTGKSIVWRLRIETLGLGNVSACSESPGRISRSTRYYSDAASFTLGPGWSPAPDVAADGNTAAKAAAGTPGPQGAFGGTFVPAPGAYDVWYRVRVAKWSDPTSQVVLGLVDVDASRYLAASTVPPIQFTDRYIWVLVASGVRPVGEDRIRFQTNITAKLSTDWYIDEAAMVPVGTPMP